MKRSFKLKLIYDNIIKKTKTIFNRFNRFYIVEIKRDDEIRLVNRIYTYLLYFIGRKRKKEKWFYIFYIVFDFLHILL